MKKTPLTTMNVITAQVEELLKYSTTHALTIRNTEGLKHLL